MKTEDWLVIGGVGVGAFLIWKYFSKPLEATSDALTGAANVAGGVVSSAGTVAKNLIEEPAESLSKVVGNYVTDTANDIQKIRDTIRSIPNTIISGAKTLVQDAKSYFSPQPLVWTAEDTLYMNQSHPEDVFTNNPYVLNGNAQSKSLTASNPTPAKSTLAGASSTQKSLITVGSTGYDFSKDLKSSNPAVVANAKSMIKKLNK